MTTQTQTPHERSRALLHRYGYAHAQAAIMKRCPNRIEAGDGWKKIVSDVSHNCLDQAEADLKASGIRDE